MSGIRAIPGWADAAHGRGRASLLHGAARSTPWLFTLPGGRAPGSAVEASGPGNVTASVGRPRPLAFTLETFILR